MKVLQKCILTLTLLFITSVIAQNAAVSSHFVSDDQFNGNIIINEVRVPADGIATYTYYEALGWQGTGAGYAGIQDHPDGRNFIFSIWDNSVHTAPIREEYVGLGTATKGFGGEGTGLKSWNFDMPWKTDTWYTLLAKSWNVGTHTYYGYWVRNGENSVWKHMVTMDVAASNSVFQYGNDSFIEDWLDSGDKRREINLKNNWKRRTNGTWYPGGSARYSVNSWDLDAGGRSYNYRTNWDGGIATDATGEYYYMVTGGTETAPTTVSPNQFYITRTETEPAYAKGVLSSIDVALVNSADLIVSWKNDNTSLPQFGHKIEIFNNAALTGTPLLSVVKSVPHQRDDTLNVSSLNTAAETYFVKLSMIDIFDQASTAKSGSFGNGVYTDVIAVRTPNGGEHYEVGDTLPITWNSTVNGTVSIELLNNNSVEAPVATFNGNTSSYNWVLPQELSTSENYKLKISSDADASVYDLSDLYFGITGLDSAHLKHSQSLTTVISFTSEQNTTSDAAMNVLDGDVNTIWHTNWSGYPAHSHEIVLKTNKSYPMSGLAYTPRMSGSNGRIADYEVYVSSDGINWGTAVTSGTWLDNSDEQFAYFPATEAQYIRLVALSAVNGASFTSAAELSVLYDGTNGEIVPPVYYDITSTAGANGSITPLGSNTIAEGRSITFNVTPDAGYEVDYVNVDAVSIGAVNSYTFNNVNAGHTIDAFFKLTPVEVTHNITAAVNGNGMISPSGVISVKDGASANYRISADIGHQIDSVVVNGTNVGAVSVYLISSITADQTVTAYFSAVTSGGSCEFAEWTSTKAYSGNDKVSWNGRDYQAKWWTKGNQPDLNSNGQGANVWNDLGVCSGM